MSLSVKIGYFFIFCVCFFNVQQIEARKYNVSYQNLETCKEYDIAGGGYSYADFFYVHKLGNNKIATNERLHLKFYVMTSMDAHILLSVNGKPRINDRVYEIVIGAGLNTFSTIRSYMSRLRMTSNMDPYILSVFDPTPIEVVQKKDGHLLVFITGYQTKPFLDYMDPAPLDINYVSFSSFGSTTAKWFYDCEFDGYASEMMQEERPLTPKQKLIAHFKTAGQNKSMPNGLSSVNFAFQLKSLSLQQNSAVLQTRLHLVTYWIDNRLAWNPAEYDNIEYVAQPKLEIWTPTLMLINGAMNTFVIPPSSQQFKVQYNGNVSLLATNIELQTWCPFISKKWPYDQHSCELQLGIFDNSNTYQKPLTLKFDNSKPLPQQQVSTLSEWQLLEVQVINVAMEPNGRYSKKGVPQSINGDTIISFVIERNSQFYKNVFKMPILASQCLILLSFLLHGYRRGALLLVVFIILCLGMMFITRHAPPAFVPNILLAYEFVAMITVTCYWLHVITIWFVLYPPKAKPSCMSLVNSSTIRLILFMRVSDSTEYVDIQENPWREIAKMLSKSALLIVILCLTLINVILCK